MIKTHRTINKSIDCDSCNETLIYPENTVLTSHIGFTIFEDTDDNIVSVAERYGWLIGGSNHLCKKCKHNGKN